MLANAYGFLRPRKYEDKTWYWTIHWIIAYIFGPLGACLITVYLLLYTETIRYVMVLYFFWMYYDWNTRYRGGRSWTRNNAFWHNFCSYFPLKLVKIVDLDPKEAYFFISVLHGIFSVGMFGSFAIDVLKCKKTFLAFLGLEIRLVTLDQHFKTYSTSFCASNARSIKYLLLTPPKSPCTGKATILIVGGAPEAMESLSGTYHIIIKKRKGFVKLTLENIKHFIKHLIEFFNTQKHNYIKNAENVTLELL
ncbi:Diacylglycerol O-acyltransferase 2-like protein 6 [Trachymyrmex zeteki]|uniref:Diacylglycerol O-acyltransferase 2-like protein 6 n=1 Tax=Mycetomoellerius zeteki TaxID=64791 RepID=A0A151WTS0_9HYME|nr:Diacylglycerol O-acyltransferase 2-like protein 6 [Trachymyrmex zeteki]